jgi:hypothetical protein
MGQRTGLGIKRSIFGGNALMKLRYAVLAFLLVGCAAKVIHPGAANSFDSSSYDTLLVAHSVIESTKADLAANKFPAAISGNVKTALNGLITAYDASDTAYLAYHAAAVSGAATPSQVSSVTQSLQSVNAATASLTAAKGN